MRKKLLERIKEIYSTYPGGHPSREQEIRTKKAIMMIALDIDVLYELLIESNRN